MDLPHPLGHGFVHRQRTGQHSGAGVRHAEQFQDPLDSAILTKLAVQSDKHHIRLADLRYPGPSCIQLNRRHGIAAFA